MSNLFLVEISPTSVDRVTASVTVAAVQRAAADVGADLIESQVTADHGRIFAILEAESSADLVEALSNVQADEISEPAQVRLVGAELETIKAARPEAGYLVEWDIPAHIDMDTYLTRKREKSPLYAQIPEVQFLRTYVREDTAKCLCFYDAPDTDAVIRAREIVSTPVDRLHVLGRVSVEQGIQL